MRPGRGANGRRRLSASGASGVPAGLSGFVSTHTGPDDREAEVSLKSSGRSEGGGMVPQ